MQHQIRLHPLCLSLSGKGNYPKKRMPKPAQRQSEPLRTNNIA